MVLSALWGSLGLLLGALGGLLGVSWAPLGCSWGLLGVSWAPLGCSWCLLGVSWASLGDSWVAVGGDFGASWRLLAGLLASSLLHVFFEAVFCSSSKLLGTILVSTTDLLTLKNKVFASLDSLG